MAEWAADMLAAWYCVACAGLLASVMCRATHMDCSTRADVRGAFLLLAAGAVAELISVLVYAEQPTWQQCVLASGILAVQIVAARLWGPGQPLAYREDPTLEVDSCMHTAP